MAARRCPRSHPLLQLGPGGLQQDLAWGQSTGIQVSLRFRRTHTDSSNAWALAAQCHAAGQPPTHKADSCHGLCCCASTTARLSAAAYISFAKASGARCSTVSLLAVPACTWRHSCDMLFSAANTAAAAAAPAAACLPLNPSCGDQRLLASQQLPVGRLQRRAGQDRWLAGGAVRVNNGSQLQQPRLAVGIG